MDPIETKKKVKEFYLNCLYVIVLVAVAIFALSFSKNALHITPVSPTMEEITPGQDFGATGFALIGGLGGIVLFFKNIKLFFSVLFGGKGASRFLVLLSTLPFAAFFIIMAISVGGAPSRPDPDLTSITTSMNTYFNAIDSGDDATYSSLLFTGTAITIGYDPAVFKAPCQSPSYSILRDMDPFFDVEIKCTGEAASRTYHLFRNKYDTNIPWQVMDVSN